MNQLLQTLQELDFPVRIFNLFQSEGEGVTKEDVLSLFNLGSSKKGCKLMDKYSEDMSNLLGAGGVNNVYSIPEHPRLVLRASRTVFEPEKLKVLRENIFLPKDDITFEEEKVERYILSDQIYDITVSSLISSKLSNHPNFNLLIGSFYCESSQKMYSLMSKNDMTLQEFIIVNSAKITPEILCNILYQYLMIIYELTNLGITDFDRHLQNIMINYTHSQDLPEVYNSKGIKISPLFDPKVKDDKLIYYWAQNGQELRIKNYGIILKAIDFGISIIERVKGEGENTKRYQIFNQKKEYNVYVPGFSCNPSNFIQIPEFINENIKAKYAIENTGIRQNVMWYFFFKNLETTFEKLGEKVVHLQSTLKEIKAIYLKDCGGGRTSFGNDLEFVWPGWYWLYRNVGVEGESIISIIQKFNKFMMDKGILKRYNDNLLGPV